VRLLESGRDGRPSFEKTYLSFRVHANAVIDMCFSDDDTRLATASGDSTARVVDMTTQTVIGILGNHSASLKQVRFQPGVNNGNVLATSSRDGSVQIWDLRCKGLDGPANEVRYTALSKFNITRRWEFLQYE
jgi:WD40 repeat protein